MCKPTTLDMETALVNYFCPRKNLIVPNVSWGMFPHEVDLCVLSPSNYASEIEIKISKSDLKQDKKKAHSHECSLIKYLWFAVPEHLAKEVQHIPERAGIIIVSWREPYHGQYHTLPGAFICTKIRKPKQATNYKWSDDQRASLLRLGCMRVWALKKKLQKLEMEKRDEEEERKEVLSRLQP